MGSRRNGAQSVLSDDRSIEVMLMEDGWSPIIIFKGGGATSFARRAENNVAWMLQSLLGSGSKVDTLYETCWNDYHSRKDVQAKLGSSSSSTISIVRISGRSHRWQNVKAAAIGGKRSHIFALILAVGLKGGYDQSFKRELEKYGLAKGLKDLVTRVENMQKKCCSSFASQRPDHEGRSRSPVKSERHDKDQKSKGKQNEHRSGRKRRRKRSSPSAPKKRRKQKTRSRSRPRRIPSRSPSRWRGDCRESSFSISSIDVRSKRMKSEESELEKPLYDLVEQAVATKANADDCDEDARSDKKEKATDSNDNESVNANDDTEEKANDSNGNQDENANDDCGYISKEATWDPYMAAEEGVWNRPSKARQRKKKSPSRSPG